MGIKENFTQAVKELTGIGKEKPPEKTPPPKSPDTVEGLKKAVGGGVESVSREIKLDTPDWSVPDWDGSEASTIRPIPKQPEAEQASSIPVAESPPASTPAAELFLSGGSTPASRFGGQVQPEQQATRQFPSSPPPPPPPPSSFQPPQAQHAQQQQNAPQSQQPAFYPPPQSVQNQNAQPLSFAQSSGRSGGMSEESELTVISRNTIIEGSIRSFADMSIDGAIKGDVETTKNIDLNGKVIGNISCNNAMMHTSEVQGNVRMKGNISMKRDTLLIGDLMSTYAEVNGKVQGNLDVIGKADVKGDAVIFGDISSSTLAVEDGALIQGYVNTTFLNKEESKNLFPDTVVINTDMGNTAPGSTT
ncbi:MAG: polymer-forming cytoskeletal protein [Oscillospiraceae bacterium]|nr:polymer-forming cytoskeletal protein [Oscillospiraceae bacterium]